MRARRQSPVSRPEAIDATSITSVHAERKRPDETTVRSHGGAPRGGEVTCRVEMALEATPIRIHKLKESKYCTVVYEGTKDNEYESSVPPNPDPAPDSRRDPP